jgi:hypothetical protein
VAEVEVEEEEETTAEVEETVEGMETTAGVEETVEGEETTTVIEVVMGEVHPEKIIRDRVLVVDPDLPNVVTIP